MLRTSLIGLGVTLTAVGVILLVVVHAFIVIPLYLIGEGALLILFLTIERRRYHPDLKRSRGRWEETGERFVDPVSGKLVDVKYNPDTGERDYIERET